MQVQDRKERSVLMKVLSDPANGSLGVSEWKQK